MKDLLKVGIVIADEDEYAPLRNMVDSLGAERKDFYTREGHCFTFEKEGRKIAVHTLLCGIGMVNAAAAATFLAGEGCDIIINSGLSGGISGIARGQIMVGTRYIEHDFDLTPLGYPMCKKPLQEYIYSADKAMLDIFAELWPDIKQGVAVSGDSFISDEGKKNFLKSEFDAMSCDMESAAVAYVCSLANIRYIALRRISDDAGNDAVSSYTDMNDMREAVLVELICDTVKQFFNYSVLW